MRSDRYCPLSRCDPESGRRPCPLGAICPVVMGQCEASAAGGACECVPILPTPLPTPTPQCTGATCAGPCIPAVSPLPCPATGVCNGPEVPVLAGQCEMSAAGACECVPIHPTPLPTPPPQCTGATCAGPCIPAVSLLPCPAAGVCNGPEVPVLAGQCEMSAAGACECVPILPTPLPTPPPAQCTSLPCAGNCTIFPTCTPGGACPQYVMLGTCQVVADTCTCVSSNRVDLSNSDSGRSVAVAVGDEVDVTLQTIGPGEYGSPVVSSGSVRFLGVSLAGTPNPGGPRQLYRFEAAASGRADVTIPHSGGLPEGSAIPAFSITIEVY